MGGWKSRTRGNVDRSLADEHDRNRGSLEAERTMATGLDSRIFDRGTGRETAPARCYKYLDPAHQESHRHAFYRDSFASGHQDIRQRFEKPRRTLEAGCRTHENSNP